MTEHDAPVYVSPDGQSEMPVRSPVKRINLEARGWTRKDGRAPINPNPAPEATTKRPAVRRQAADE